ncbi:saccharopine dehydrogenase NADP-binding domain-containing protein [Phenylobacterium sp. LjRoot219]|uniref:saccharopine dehydrogenase family protein n=1 Tax=Phenylobacterium sp. LjRoot219 TaxID=3342283 RepID=UPI003ED0B1EE
MKRVVVLGAGKIGSTVADLLAGSGDYEVVVADSSDQALQRLETTTPVIRRQVAVEDEPALRDLLAGAFAVVSAAPHNVTAGIARAARQTGSHYLDLTEDVAATHTIKGLAEGAVTAFIPQCGLAPGFISIVAHDLTTRFDSLLDVKMGVGALPQFPANALNYNLTWSTDGLINEYCEPCEAIVDGAMRRIQPLEDLEQFALDGVVYEAFNTSGGLGTLWETLAGRVRNLSYRTIRYPGHAAIMKALLNDLRLRERREVLKDILENALPATFQDVVIVYASVSGERRGRLVQETYAQKIYAASLQGQLRSAIQITTASAICTVLDLLVQGVIPQHGFVRQEQVALQAFLENRFGRVFAPTPARVAA